MTPTHDTNGAPLVRLSGASVSRAGEHLLRRVDFRLEAGERWALLGANGAGKTTLLRLLRGDLSPDISPNLSSDLARDPATRGTPGSANDQLPGSSPERLTKKSYSAAPRVYDLPGAGGPQPSPLGLRQRLALVSGDMQDLYARNQWATTGLEAVLSGFYDTALLYSRPTQAEREAALALLADLGLEHLAARRMARLSTGQARSLLLARALVCKPDVLLLDECLEGLDAPARAAFLAVLDRAAGADARLAMLFSTHRSAERSELPACLRLALALEGGRVIASGPLEEVITQLETRTRAEAPMAAQALVPGGIAEERKQPERAASERAKSKETDPKNTAPKQAESALPQISGSPAARDSMPTPPTVTPPAALPTPTPLPQGALLARISGADVVVDGAPLLHGIDWTLRAGEHWALLGPNGAGKTTLLSLLAGELWPSALCGPPGRVEYGFAQPGETPDETRRRIGRVGAALDRDYGWNLRVDEAVWSGAFGSIGLFAEADGNVRQRTRQLLEFFGLGRLAGRGIQTLSRGQLRRVMLARAMLGLGGRGPALLLLDEPMAGLDARTRRATRELLARLAGAGTPMVMVTHHLRDLPEQVNRVLALKAGRVVFCGTREDYEMRKEPEAP
ncbi:ATP-binding cassette domain-containing protein [Humidesulfovibrio sp.]